MLASAPFDNFGGDAMGSCQIIHPLRCRARAGVWSVAGGALLLVLREQNNCWSSAFRLPGARCRVNSIARAGPLVFIYGSLVLLALASVFLIEAAFPINSF